jgi:hypothetical protein
MIQISLVIKLVMAQQGASNSNFFGASWFVATNASFQISLVLTLVKRIRCWSIKFHWLLRWL